jgi:four helix bundle protein
MYWLELLKETEYLTTEQYGSMCDDAIEIIKLITSIIKKQNPTLTNNH